MPCGGLIGLDLELDRPRGTLHASPRAVRDSGPGGGESPPPVMPQCGMFVPW